jgi:hypothetical protein
MAIDMAIDSDIDRRFLGNIVHRAGIGRRNLRFIAAAKSDHQQRQASPAHHQAKLPPSRLRTKRVNVTGGD